MIGFDSAQEAASRCIRAAASIDTWNAHMRVDMASYTCWLLELEKRMCHCSFTLEPAIPFAIHSQARHTNASESHRRARAHTARSDCTPQATRKLPQHHIGQRSDDRTNDVMNRMHRYQMGEHEFDVIEPWQRRVVVMVVEEETHGNLMSK